MIHINITYSLSLVLLFLVLCKFLDNSVSGSDSKITTLNQSLDNRFVTEIIYKRPGSSKHYNHRRAWPKLALFVPVSLSSDPKRVDEFQTFLLRSLLLFWPLEKSNVSFVAVVDYEQQYDPKTKTNTKEYDRFYQSILANEHRFPGGLTVKVNKYVNYYNTGHDRQQYLQMIADEFIDDPDVEYIGIVDTDTLFITYCDIGDIFESGNPVVNGRFGTMKGIGWGKIPKRTFNSTGFLEPMRTMSYFPVVIHRSHFKMIREYLMKYHNNPNFGEVYKNNIQTSPGTLYCAFNIMKDYVWYLHPMNKTWNGIDPPPDKGSNGDLRLYTKEMYYPKPRIAIHARYVAKYELQVYDNKDDLNVLFQQGLCLSPPFPNSEYCKSVISKGYWEEMHRFEFFDWTDPTSYSAQELQEAYLSRYSRIRNEKFVIPKDEQFLLINIL